MPRKYQHVQQMLPQSKERTDTNKTEESLGLTGYELLKRERRKETQGIPKQQGRIPAKISRSGYYDYVKRMDIPAKDLPLAEKIRECQEKCGKTYGYRRVHMWIEKENIHHTTKKHFVLYRNTIYYQNKMRTYDEVHLLIGQYIRLYNNKRIQLKTKLTPLETRSQYVA